MLVHFDQLVHRLRESTTRAGDGGWGSQSEQGFLNVAVPVAVHLPQRANANLVLEIFWVRVAVCALSRKPDLDTNVNF